MAAARILVLLSSSAIWGVVVASAADCQREIDQAAHKHGVPVEVLNAIGQTETGRGDGMRPNALNIAGQSHYDLTRKQALALFAASRRRGIKLIDVGCMQINHHYHKEHFSSVDEMLEPKYNVDYAARFLKKLYEEERNWTMAVARYHAGKRNLKAQRRYICAVIKKLVSVGDGAWTPSASGFCNPRPSRCPDGRNPTVSGDHAMRSSCGFEHVGPPTQKDRRDKSGRGNRDWTVTISHTRRRKDR